mmetsp:Transcript_13687/g.28232  ORF Transcript_13687/g.28232 Transcript_13687/m.28232 type:complete len:102 (-) Transcript_13687:23-328(-)
MTRETDHFSDASRMRVAHRQFQFYRFALEHADKGRNEPPKVLGILVTRIQIGVNVGFTVPGKNNMHIRGKRDYDQSISYAGSLAVEDGEFEGFVAPDGTHL